MGDFDPEFVRTLSIQSWSLYGVGMFLILLRLYARIHRLGIKSLQADDYLMAAAGGLYTMLIVCLNVIAGGGGSNLYPPEQFAKFTPLEIEQRIQGSKIVVISEQAMLNVIYLIKICMLLMYTRLTLGLQVQKMVLYLSVYVAVGWVATEIAFFTACTPFVGYWAMPPPNPQCTTLEHYAIVQACFNISSDALMLLIPLPLITRLNVPWKQKFILMLIFSMGIFVVLAAVLTKVFNLANIWDPSYMLWYTREASVAVYVANLPMIWPLLREWFPILKAMTPGQKISSGRLGATGYGVGGSSNRMRSGTGHKFGSKRGGDTAIITTIHGKGESSEDLSSHEGTEMRDVERGDSWEMNDPSMSQGDVGLVGNGGGSAWASQKELKDGGITMTTTVQISEETIPYPGLKDGRPPSTGVIRDQEKGIPARPKFTWDFVSDEKKRSKK